MGRPVTPARRQAGFTLVELMVAATVTVLVTGSTVAILRSSAAARERVDRQMSAQQEARAGLATIAASLRNAFRSEDANAIPRGTNGYLDDMPADSIRLFVVSRRMIRPGQPESDVMECQFFLDRPEDTAPPALMRRIDPTRNEEPDGGGVLERVAENIVGLDLTYHDGAEWCDEWTEERKNWPLAVSVRLAVLVDPEHQKVWTTSRLVNFPHRGSKKQNQQEGQ